MCSNGCLNAWFDHASRYDDCVYGDDDGDDSNFERKEVMPNPVARTYRTHAALTALSTQFIHVFTLHHITSHNVASYDMI